ncbi:MAG: hypothetical protein FGM61_08545 [Sediminibacterium sp.]|nr:hypothetical protein [Sediminibacterium sp.]
MKKSFLRKYVESVLAILALYVLFVFLLIMVINIPGMNKIIPEGISFSGFGIPAEIFLIFFPFVGGFLLAMDWGLWEKVGVANPASWHGCFRDIVATGLACVVFLYAYIFYQLPFSQGRLSISDTLAGDLHIGELIGVLLYKNILLRIFLVAGLVVAAGLVLFRPTRRIGALVAGIFFLLTALLQGFFSQLQDVQVFIFVFGLVLIPVIYFITLSGKDEFRQEKKPIRTVLHFFQSPGNIIRIGLMVFVAWLFIDYFQMEKKPIALYGKWKVLRLNRNGDTTNPEVWKTDSLAWSRVYIEGAHFIIMSPNPYHFENRRATKRNYTYDPSRHTIIFREGSWDQHPDTMQVSLTGVGVMQWVGKWRSDSLRILLVREL